MEQLEQIDDVAVQILTNSEADGWTTNFFTSKPVDIGDHDRQYVMAPGSMIRYRMMCILAITRKNAAPCCLLIVEDDPVFMRLIAAGIQEPDLIHEGVCEAVGDFLLENYRKEVVTVKQVFSHFQI